MVSPFLPTYQVGSSEIIRRIVEDLKDEGEPYRKMVMETIDKSIQELGTADIDARLEEVLIDGILYAFQEQAADDSNVMLNGFGTVINSLGLRAKPYLPQICGTIKWRLNNKSAKIRQQACKLFPKCLLLLSFAKIFTVVLGQGYRISYMGCISCFNCIVLLSAEYT
jgi:splicing factor 3B subunit 1